MIKNSGAHFFYGIYLETLCDPAMFTHSAPSVLWDKDAIKLILYLPLKWSDAEYMKAAAF